MALKTHIKRIAAAKAEYDAELAKVGKKAGKELAKLLGPLIPPGFVLEWTQYTPSFNDGDPCTFRVGYPMLKRQDAEEVEEDDDLEDGEYLPEDDDGEVTDIVEGDEEVEEVEDDDGEETDDDSEFDEMELDDAVKKYGKKNKRVSFKHQEFNYKTGKRESVTRYYTDHGFPAIEGYSKKELQELQKLWHSLPESFLERAFGDGARVTIYPNGKFTNDEYYE